MTEIDISSEEYRVYVYSGSLHDCDRAFRIERPVTLFVIEDDKGVTHRIIDKDGLTHRPERGWVGIAWMPRKGESAFVA